MSDYPFSDLLIDGEWRRVGKEPVIDPFDEREIGGRAHAGLAELDECVAAAKSGMKAWGALGPVGRQQVMSRAADLLRERSADIARSISMEQGKTVREAAAEIARAADLIEWDGHEGRRIYGRVIPSREGYHNAVYHQPIGIVAAFSPWNFPIASPARKIGSALAAGCPVILKAAEDTPVGAYELARAFVDAGLPRGVLGLVYGDPPEVSNRLINHPDVRMISFTGSVPVGKQLTAMAGAQMKPVVMELGGHSPVFISATADIEAAAELAVLGKAVNAGQVCVSPTRFFVEASVHDRFAERLAKAASSLAIGRGTDETTQMGPLASRRRLEAIEALVADAAKGGAEILAGGRRTGDKGFAHEMTVLANIAGASRVMVEEPFGPVALLVSVSSVEEAVTKANSVPFGLAGYAFTRSAKDIHYLTEHLEVGSLAINHLSSSEPETPFGGIKDSGIGREGGVEGPLNFTVTKTVMTYLA